MNLFQLKVKQEDKSYCEYFYILTKSKTPNLDCVKIDWDDYTFMGLELYAKLNEKLFIDENQKFPIIKI